MLPRLLCFSRESSTKPLFPAWLYLSIDTAWIPTPTHSKMYFCLSSYVTFFLCIPLLRSGVTLSYTAHMIHNLHNEDGFQTESSRLSQRCKCEVYCTLHQLQITPQIYTPDYTLGWKTFAKLECVGRSGGTAWCCRFPSGGGMNHITHSFHGTQNIQGTHRQLCMESYSSALCPVPSFYIQTCLCQNQ